MKKLIKGDFTQQLLKCPYCGDNRSLASHRTACYKVKFTKTGKLAFKCVACGKSFGVMTTGEFILRKDTLQVI